MKIYKLGLSLLGVLLFAACVETDYTTDEEKSDLAIVSSNVEFGPVAATGGIKVACSRPLTVSGGSDWCKVTTAGDSITVSVSKYTGDVSRNTTVDITDGLRKLRVPVHQTAGSLVVGKDSYVTGFRKDEFDLSVLSNMDYKVTVEESAASWLTLTSSADGYKVNVAAYDGGAVREGHIYFSSAAKNDTVTVTQYDVRGKYTATYTDNSGNAAAQTMELTDKTLIMNDVIGGTWQVPVTLSDDYSSLTITAGNSSYMGVTAWNQYLYVVLSLSTGYLLNGGNYQADLSGTLSQPVYAFKEGTSDSGTIDGFWLQAFYTQSTAWTVNGSSNMGYYHLCCRNLKLVKQ